MLKSRVWAFWFFSFVVFLVSALLVSILSFLGVYYYQSLDHYFHEGYLGTLYPVALLAISSLSCFLFHLRETSSPTFIFKHPLSQKIPGFGVALHLHIRHWMICLKFTKKLISNCITGWMPLQILNPMRSQINLMIWLLRSFWQWLFGFSCDIGKLLPPIQSCRFRMPLHVSSCC